MAANKNKPIRKADTKQAKDDVHLLETVTTEKEVASSSSEDDYIQTILHLGNKASKFLVTATINDIDVQMEMDSGADKSTIPWELYQEKLAAVCKLVPTKVFLYQYDKSHLKVKGQCKVTVQVLGRKIVATLIVVDVKHQVPLFGRDWMIAFGLDLPTILHQTLQVCQVSSDTTGIESLMGEFTDLFKEELGVLQGIEATIELKPTAMPRFCKNRPVPFALKEKVETLLKAQVDQGELRPVDKSEWATPIVVVPKSDGGIRICGDFKVTINPVICPQVFPLPTPEEMFSALANGESFTKLDLSRAYKQMKVKEECQHLLTINTHLGLYCYSRLPFGISTAPALWQKAMTQVLQGIPGVVYFLDDILITGRSRQEHEANLRQVLSRLQQYGLRLNRAKCQFFQTELEFLGHIVSCAGVRPTDSRIKAIQKAPPPTNKQQLQSFLGLMTYNAKFLPNLAQTLHPMYQLLRKNTKWCWKLKHEKSFMAAKQLLCQDCALTHYDVNKPLKLYCDASATGLGACLAHVMPDKSERPVAYASRTLTTYAQIEREALAIVFAVRRFHQYLYGKPFTLVTDHRPLCKIFGEKEGIPPLAAARMQRWALLLSAYQYNIEYIAGKSNFSADCMSRLPSLQSKRDKAEKIQAIFDPFGDLPVTADKIARASIKDPVIATVLTAVQHGSWPQLSDRETLIPYHRRRHELSVVDNCLLWGRRVVIPQVFRQSLLEELHSNHLGITKMKALARNYLWWPQLDSDLEATCRNCHECCINSAKPPSAPAHPWIVPKQPWERIHIDHAQWGKHLLLIMIDAFTKWPEVHLVSSTSATQTIDKLRTTFATHGVPVTLVSDNGPPFTSVQFEAFMKSNGISHKRVPPYHPSSNGLAENFVRTVKQALDKSDKSWSVESAIAKILAAYRNTPHITTSKTPAELLLKRLPRTRLSLIHPCVEHRMQSVAEQTIGEHQPRVFKERQPVALMDFRPNATTKWRQATVIQQKGPLTYDIEVDGQFRSAHVDHLKPWPVNLSNTPDQVALDPPIGELSSTTRCDDSVTASALVPLADDHDHECNQDPHSTTTRPQRSRRPPRRLIEELP